MKHSCILSWQELLSLLDHLDKNKVGHVMLEEFVSGLQAVKNTAQVAATDPFKSPQDMPPHRRHTISGQVGNATFICNALVHH